MRTSQPNPTNNNPYHRRCPRPLLLLLAGVGAGLCLAVRGMVWSSSSPAAASSSSSSLGPTVDAGMYACMGVFSIHPSRLSSCVFVCVGGLFMYFFSHHETNK